MAPAPTMRTRISQFLLLLDTGLCRTLLIRGSRFHGHLHTRRGTLCARRNRTPSSAILEGLNARYRSMRTGTRQAGSSLRRPVLFRRSHDTYLLPSCLPGAPCQGGQRNVLSVGSGGRTCGFPTLSEVQARGCSFLACMEGNTHHCRTCAPAHRGRCT